jgi:divinyl protochlorophyllide a 8-vinyl-reductase
VSRPPPGAPRIGPNAVIRLAEALRAQDGALAQRVFAASGLSHYLAAPPQHMVDEAEVARLHRVLRAQAGPGAARAFAFDAGRRTGAYLLAHRIPAPAQRLLRALPRRWAAALLGRAIRRNAWTFAGSGGFELQGGPRPSFTVAQCALCRGCRADTPLCDFYAGTFTALFAALVDPAARAREVACAAQGDPACRFALDWPARRRHWTAPVTANALSPPLELG